MDNTGSENNTYIMITCPRCHEPVFGDVNYELLCSNCGRYFFIIDNNLANRDHNYNLPDSSEVIKKTEFLSNSLQHLSDEHANLQNEIDELKKEKSDLQEKVVELESALKYLSTVRTRQISRSLTSTIWEQMCSTS